MSNFVIFFFLNNYHNHYKLNIQNIRLLNIVVTSFSVRDDWIKIGLTTKDIGVSEPEFKNRKIEAQVLKTTTRQLFCHPNYLSSRCMVESFISWLSCGTFARSWLDLPKIARLSPWTTTPRNLYHQYRRHMV